MDRQAWLMKAIDILRHDFRRIGETVPEEISVFPNWPIDNYLRDYLGVCIQYRLSSRYEVYIIPLIDNGLRVLEVLVHELVHCVVGGRDGHGKQFQRVAMAIGLNSTRSHSLEILSERLREVEQILGTYPEEI